MLHFTAKYFHAVLRFGIGCLCLAFLITSCTPMLPNTVAGQATLQPTLTPTAYKTPVPAPTLRVPEVFNEAPDLSQRTNKGELPSIYERLPIVPKVVAVNERMGSYGGTWHMVIQPAADEGLFVRTVAYEPLVRWTKDWTGIEPNLAETFTVNQNATEYTIMLRRGLRWSDGALFTTEDIKFWYEGVLLNKELTLEPPAWLKSRGEAARFEFVDNYVFKVHFPYPNSLFLEQLATPEALMITGYPQHYLKDFHPDYTSPERIEALVKDGGYDSWVDMFTKRVGITGLDNGSFVDPERPRMTAWVLRTPYVPGAGTIRWERNPYYWKVDRSGNQLPYIDNVEFVEVDDPDMAINQIIDGSVDMQNVSALGIDTDAVLESIEALGFDRYELNESSNNVMVIHLNMSHKEALKREMFRNQNFRIGLSHAINRQEILDFLYQGAGKPWQAAPDEDSLFYDPRMGTMYVEYSVEKANQFLDKAGFLMDQVGNRIGPDGLPISFSIEVPESQPQHIAMLHMITKYWAEVGIRVQIKVQSMPLFLATVRSNLHDAAVWTGGATMFEDVLLDPANYLPSSQNTFWAVTWANWFNRVPGFENQVPDSAARKSTDMYAQIRTVRDPHGQIRILKNALLYSREAFYTIGIATGIDRYGIVRSSFHNVPEQMPAAWLYPDPAPTNPEQYFISSAR